MAAAVGVPAAPATAKVGHCHTYNYKLSGTFSAKVTGSWHDTSGSGTSAQATETATETYKKGMYNPRTYAVYNASCKPTWQVRLGGQPNGAFAMSGSWYDPNLPDGPPASGDCSRHASNVDMGVFGNASSGTHGILKLSGDTGSADTSDCGGMSWTDMNGPYETGTNVPTKFPSGAPRSFTLHLHAARSYGGNGGSYSLTWDATLKFKRIDGICTYFVFDYCGNPPR